jgi:dTDP-4-dehydrorhamnose reductase
LIALLGGTGYIGTAFREYLDAQKRPYKSLGRTELDYYDVDALSGWIERHSPRFLINAAGYTGKPNVDACELQPRDCLRGNTVLPAVVRRACERTQLPWGHISSGCIYTGTRPDGSAFTEEDLPNFSFAQDNCSFYSGCKALAEDLLRGAARCYIWRPRLPFNQVDSSRNYLSKLLRYDCLVDVRNSMTQLDEFVAACVQCFDRQLPFGIYHLTCSGSTTTRDVVRVMLRRGLTNKAFQFFASEEEFMQKAALAPRSNCILNNEKALRAGLRLSHIDEAIDKAILAWTKN